MIARAQFLAAVRSCIGTPVGHYGRTIGGALDCVGVPWASAVACGLELPPTPRYGKLPSGDELRSGLALFCDLVADPADAHILQVCAGRQPRHVVVPVGDGMVVHAWARHRIVQETREPRDIALRWRIRGIE